MNDRPSFYLLRWPDGFLSIVRIAFYTGRAPVVAAYVTREEAEAARTRAQQMAA